MWIAKREYHNYQVQIRSNGKFTANDEFSLVAALFEWNWSNITAALIARCRNRAAARLLDGDIAEAEKWIARAKAIRGIE